MVRFAMNLHSMQLFELLVAEWARESFDGQMRLLNVSVQQELLAVAPVADVAHEQLVFVRCMNCHFVRLQVIACFKCQRTQVASERSNFVALMALHVHFQLL